MCDDHASKVRNRLASFVRERSANAVSEYAICLSLLILVAMGAIMSIGTGFRGLYYTMAAALP